MIGFVNGMERWELPDGLSVGITRVVERSIGREPRVELAAWRRENEVWRTQLESVEGDHTSGSTDVMYADFRASVWRPAGLLVIAGYATAFAIDLTDGSIRHRMGLLFNDSSLDILELGPAEREGFFVVVSPKRVWVLNERGEICFRYEPTGWIDKFRGVRGGALWLMEYDVTDPVVPLVERTVEIEQAVT